MSHFPGSRHIAMLLLTLTGGGFAWGQATQKPTPPAKPAPASREQKEDVCTTAPRAEWLPEDEMRLLAEHRGYRIKTFKVANSSCYEIYGFDRQGQIVEAYFNPVTSRLVRQNIAK